MGSVSEYLEKCKILEDPKIGRRLIESMIGGRPISTFELVDSIRMEFEIIGLQGAVDSTSGEDAVGESETTSRRSHQKGDHKHLTIRLIEVPCPKPGRPYPSGWEHVEFAVGGDGRWQEFLNKYFFYTGKDDRAQTVSSSASPFPWIANLDVHRNADISFNFTMPAPIGDESEKIHFNTSGHDSRCGDASQHHETMAGRCCCVKFHEFPLDAVIRAELAEGDVEEIPEGYFEKALQDDMGRS